MSVEGPSLEGPGPGGADEGTLSTTSGGHSRSSERPVDDAQGRGGRSSGRKSERSTRSTGSAPFVSYVAVGVDEGGDPDGLVHEERMALEEAAIDFILSREGGWNRTRKNNEGFDLVEVAGGREYAWCEVKAMSVNLDDRPVTMSHAQFKFAQERGAAYWLYIVERAGTEDARIVRIQDPAGKAKTFTFDKGWLDVAETD